MEQSKIDTFLATSIEKLPAEKIPLLKQQFENLSDDKMMILQVTQLKDTTTMLLISLFLGHLGIDRFILGNTGLGVVKLITCGGCGVWTIIDWFKIQDMTKQWNFRKLMMTIDPMSPMAHI